MTSIPRQELLDHAVLQSGDVPVGITKIEVVGGHLYMVGSLREFEDNASGALALAFVPDDGLTGRRVYDDATGENATVVRVSFSPPDETHDASHHVALLRHDDGSFTEQHVVLLRVIEPVADAGGKE